jgi:hypothetical protein
MKIIIISKIPSSLSETTVWRKQLEAIQKGVPI